MTLLRGYWVIKFSILIYRIAMWNWEPLLECLALIEEIIIMLHW